jgi:hypothetical protein
MHSSLIALNTCAGELYSLIDIFCALE